MQTNSSIQTLSNSNNQSMAMSIPLHPYTIKELAGIYGISVPTFRNWLKLLEEKIGKRNGYYYTIPQVRKIFTLLEFPSVMYEGDSG